MDASHALLKELCEGFGPPGHEEEIAGLMRKHLRGLGEVSKDGLGSIICKKKGTSDDPRIMVAGHMDEVGFMVKGITKEGFIRFLPMISIAEMKALVPHKPGLTTGGAHGRSHH